MLSEIKALTLIGAAKAGIIGRAFYEAVKAIPAIATATIKPFEPEHLKTASVWWGTFLNPVFQDLSEIQIQKQIYDHLEDVAKFGWNSNATHDKSGTLVTVSSVEKDGIKMLEVSASHYIDKERWNRATKIMTIGSDGNITVFDRSHDHKNHSKADINHQAILTKTVPSTLTLK